MLQDKHGRSQSLGQPLEREFWYVCLTSRGWKWDLEWITSSLYCKLWGGAKVTACIPGQITMLCSQHLVLPAWELPRAAASPQIQVRQKPVPLAAPEKSKCYMLSSPFFPSPERSWEQGFPPNLMTLCQGQGLWWEGVSDFPKSSDVGWFHTNVGYRSLSTALQILHTGN